MGGMAGRRNGILQLKRVGPFIPPLSVVGWDLIVTEEMRSILSQSEFRPIRLKQVHKTHIVRWEWSQLAEADDLHGEPEDMILLKPHDPDTASLLGKLYELVLPTECTVVDYETNWSLTNYALNCKQLPEGDLFRARFPGGTCPMCSSKFRDWILTLDEVHPWISFCPAKIKLVGTG